MANRFLETVFTPSVQAEQRRHGSRDAFARLAARRSAQPADPALGQAEVSFIGARDSFYMATVSSTGWPHIQHRGGPAGFVHVLDPRTLAWADYRGNRQYISIGNVADNGRVALIFMDYPAQRRLKVLGRLVAAEIGERPDLRASLANPDYDALIEHAMQVTIEGFDWNCPQHITPRFTATEVASAMAPLRRRLAELQAQLEARDQ